MCIYHGILLSNEKKGPDSDSKLDEYLGNYAEWKTASHQMVRTLVPFIEHFKELKSSWCIILYVTTV